MTHSLNFSDISEKLFILKQLQSASREYCRNIGISQNEDSCDWLDYERFILPIVSGYMIEVAAKIRIFQDSFKKEIDSSVFSAANDAVIKSCPVGKVYSGDFKLTVRETCNKIIHATRFELKWVTRNSKTYEKYSYWSGLINLFGEKGANEWHLELDSTAWCVAIDDYLDEILSRVSLDALRVL